MQSQRVFEIKWRSPWAGPFLVVFFVLMLMIVERVEAMGKLCIFSSVRGIVLDHGKPVESATIERIFEWQWKQESGRDETRTTVGGEFSLPAIWRGSLLGSILPHEPFVRQTILIHYAGQTYKGWMFNKGEYAENGELNGRPISLVCRLENAPDHHGEVYGICEIR